VGSKEEEALALVRASDFFSRERACRNNETCCE
jgi:hypothetical protein